MIYDVIGDIHGHAEPLQTLLAELGYRVHGGSYRHADPDRMVIFLGDFVDRGPQIRETLGIVRRMIDGGDARAVMGNHEYNAICFHTERRSLRGRDDQLSPATSTPDDEFPADVAPEPQFNSNVGPGSAHRPDPDWLRPRSNKNLFQHIETLHQFRNDRKELRDYLTWFRTLPLYLDLESLRIVHACWDDESLAVCRDALPAGNLLTEPFLDQSAIHGSPAYEAIDTLLKGKEIPLPDGERYFDKDDNLRSRIRVAWWKRASGRTYDEMLFPTGRGSSLERRIPDEVALRIPGYLDPVPVFFGHYWLTAERAEVQTDRICCLDYSVAKGGYLAAYTWTGESTVSAEKLTLVPARA